MTHIIRLCLFLLVVTLLLPGCSAERNNPLSKTYHNITARYNGYFLARQKMEEVEAKVWEAMPNDYNQVLPIFPPLDTTVISPLRPDLEDIIKKASIPIQRHKNSRWIDDSYVLIGKARFYQGAYEDAIRTFKYVNLTSKENATKHEALVWLMRTFIASRDHEEAVQVSDYLNKLNLNQENFRDLSLTRAYYLTVVGASPQKIIDNLNYALPNISQRDERSRVHFILAQLHQSLGQDEPAHTHYAAILRQNPPYELGFYSKLSMGQVSEINSSGEKAKIDRYFRKLLKDRKNEEYRDKIYYEMARFELKQQQYDKALEYLRQSVQASTGNTIQQAYSYLLAGRIYFENLQKYRPAQIYYDSALQVYPPDAADYAGLAERRDILTEFADQITTIETEDSLQVLARLDTASLNRRITEIIAQQEEQRVQAQKMQEARMAQASRKRNRSQNAGPGTLAASLDNNTGGAWYFDNPATLATARSEFARRWGDRALQDNWRRVNQRTADLDQAGNGIPVADTDAPDPQEQQQAQRQQYLQNIPSTPEQLAESDHKIEAALYTLGNIYQHKLKEPAQAIETYENLLARFPNTQEKAEVYYSLFLIHRQANDGRQNHYANLIKNEFPASRYANLIDNPHFDQISSADQQLLRQLYDSAYTLYTNERYQEAIALTTQIAKQYPESELHDKVAFLDVLLTGRTQSPAVYEMALLQFIEGFPASLLQERAMQMLTSYEAFASGELNQPTPVGQEQVPPADMEFNAAQEAEPISSEAAPETIGPALHVAEPASAQTIAEETTEPAPAEPESTEPIAAEPAPAEPESTESIAAEPAPAEPESTESIAAEPAPAEPESTEPIAAEPVPAEPVPAEPVPAEPVPAEPVPAEPAPAEGVPAEPSPYESNPQAAHYFGVVYPAGDSSFAKIKEQFAAHNTRYHQSKRLEIEEFSLGNNMTLLLLKGFANSKTANAYAKMQKTKSSPLSKISGVEFTTFVISAANLPVLQQRQNVEEYMTFFQDNYQK